MRPLSRGPQKFFEFALWLRPARVANFGARAASCTSPMVSPERMNFGHAPRHGGK
jgi:hypothetical protein